MPSDSIACVTLGHVYIPCELDASNKILWAFCTRCGALIHVDKKMQEILASEGSN